MDNAIDVFDGFVKGSSGGNIVHDGEGEAAVIAFQEVRVCLADFIGSGLAANGSTNL